MVVSSCLFSSTSENLCVFPSGLRSFAKLVLKECKKLCRRPLVLMQKIFTSINSNILL